MGFLDDLDMDKDLVLESLVLIIVLVLVVVLMVTLCCHLHKVTQERRRKEKMVEDAESFFSFHEALPHSAPAEPGHFTSLCQSAIFSLSGNPVYPGHVYTTGTQTPAFSHPGCGGATAGPSAVLLDPDQHVSTPTHPPSYFTAGAAPPPYQM